MPALAEAPESPAAVEETAPALETPASPEPVASSAPEPTSSETPAPETKPARTRGPDGRFIKADGTQVSDAEQATLETEAAAPTPPPAPATTPPPEPFVFRADGKRIPIPGSALSPEGHLTIPAEQVPVIRQLLSEGLAHRGSWQREQQEMKQRLTEATTVGDAKVKKYNDAALYLYEQLEGLLGDDPRMQLIRDRLDIALQRADLAIPQGHRPPMTATAAPVQGSDEGLVQAARSALEEELDVLLDGAEARRVYADPKDRDALIARHQRRLNSYFVEQEDGTVALDRHALRDDFLDDLAVRQQGQHAIAEARKAAAFNVARATPPVIPPVVGSRGPSHAGTPTPTSFDKTDREKGRAEYRKWAGLP